MLDFDEYCGGDVQQRKRSKYTRVTLARDELFRLNSEDRRRVVGRWGLHRIDTQVWRLEEPSTWRNE